MTRLHRRASHGGQAPRRAPGLETLARTFLCAVPHHRNDPSRVAVFYLPNRSLRELKRRHLKKDAAFVNVLAFPEPPGFPHPERRGRFLGEIYLNERYAARRERDQRRALVMHGVLHLLGFSHDRKRDTIRMESLEAKLSRRFP
jgi:probable rRNA maturation factor